MWKNVFPEYAVKQALREAELERGDEHIITAMQSDLLTRSVLSVLKPAIIHCIHNKRKYINNADIDVGKSLSLFPSSPPPAVCGSLLDANEFYKVVQEHIVLCMTHIEKNVDMKEFNIETEYKISQETLTRLQNEIEGCIRGFIQRLAIMNTNPNFRQFEQVMSNVLGDSSYVTSDHTYSPF